MSKIRAVPSDPPPVPGADKSLACPAAPAATGPQTRADQRSAPVAPAPLFLAAAVQQSGHPDQLREGVAVEEWPSWQRSGRDPVEQSEAILQFLAHAIILDLTPRWGLRWPALAIHPTAPIRSGRSLSKLAARAARPSRSQAIPCNDRGRVVQRSPQPPTCWKRRLAGSPQSPSAR